MKRALLSFAIFPFALCATAYDHYWIGPASGGRWSDKNNWSGGSVPGEGPDSCVFTNDAAIVTDSKASLSSLRFRNGCRVVFKRDGATGAAAGVTAASWSFADGASLTLDGASLAITSRTGIGTNCAIRLRNGANLVSKAVFNDVGANSSIIVEGGSTFRHGGCRNGYWEGMCGVSIIVRDGSLFSIDNEGTGGSFTTARAAGNSITVAGGSTFRVAGSLYTGSGTVISNDNSTITVGGKLFMGQADRKRNVVAGEQFFFAGEDAQMVVAGAVEFNNEAAASAGATFHFAVPERGFKDAPFRATSLSSRIFGNPTNIRPDGVNGKFVHVVIPASSPALAQSYPNATLTRLFFTAAGLNNPAFLDCRAEGADSHAEFLFTAVDGRTPTTAAANIRYVLARLEGGAGGKPLAARPVLESKGVADNTTASANHTLYSVKSAVSQLAEEPLKTYAVLHVDEDGENLSPVSEKAISSPGNFQMTWTGTEYVRPYRFRIALETRTAAGEVVHVEWSPVRTASTPCMVPLGPSKVSLVQVANAYNSWPMAQSVGDKRLVCAYSRGSRHTTGEPGRGVFARVSDDGGETWSNEVCVCNSREWGEVTVGKGLDASGAMLLWVRRQDRRGWLGGTFHDLYRTRDGIAYEKIASPELDPWPIQVMDVFHLPDGKLMSLWFAGDYSNGYTNNSWGVLESSDNGATWSQRTVEAGLRRDNWPTEPSGVHLGGGRILVVARCEGDGFQYQMTSEDCGRTWKRVKTNISDVRSSTPSLILDPSTGLLYNYYYHRHARLLKRRVANADFIFGHPGEWPEPELLAKGNEINYWDAGNVNATPLGGHHFAATYTGTETKAIIVTVRAPLGR